MSDYQTLPDVNNAMNKMLRAYVNEDVASTSALIYRMWMPHGLMPR
jgi:hypothetical protein